MANKCSFLFNKMGALKTLLPFLLLCAVACKKNDPSNTPAPVVGTRLQLSLDSLYLFAKETYLWQDQLPSYDHFNPRQYVTPAGDLASLRSSLEAITNLAINPQTQKPYEYRSGHNQPLYSYIAEGNIITGRRAEVNIDGKGNDFGFGMSIIGGTTAYISYVEDGSPAAQAGITRGMQVMSVDGLAIPLTDLLINELLSGSSIGINLRMQDGSTIHHTLTKTGYNASPILKSVVLSAGTKRAGYIALARFSNLATAQESLNAAFDVFANEQLTNIIVDLRYNSGGYVETAEHVANLLGPDKVNGAVMYEEHYNTLLQQGKAPILKTIPYLDSDRKPVYINGRPATYGDVDFSVARNTYRFSKKGNLHGVKSIVFIVSGATASASELLINSFKPYVDVKLIGTKTYGKPVGYFGIGIDLFTIHLAQFRILNSQQAGDYYDGMAVDIAGIDDVTKDFGDPLENCLSKALEYIGNSSFRLRGNSVISPVEINDIQGRNNFVHYFSFPRMVETRLSLQR